MKRIIVIFLAILCLCGVGFLGYLIFRTKNIEKVELAGNMQTLYIVGDKIDFEDAKLKVTYKNGNIKMVDIGDNVDVSLFSTSLETSGKMKITYKGHTIEVPYNVVSNGLYYLTKYTVDDFYDDTNDFNQTYTRDSSKLLIHLKGDGICDYYYKTLKGEYYMHDGFYDKSYNYSIKGDSIKVNLNGDKFDLKAVVDSGKMYLKSVEKTMSNDENDPWEVERKVKLFKLDSSMKTDRRISNPDPTEIEKIATFRKGETIKTSGEEIILKVNYSNATFLKTVYVYVSDGMFKKSHGIDTSKLQTSAHHAYGYYYTITFIVSYTVSA